MPRTRASTFTAISLPVWSVLMVEDGVILSWNEVWSLFQPFLCGVETRKLTVLVKSEPPACCEGPMMNGAGGTGLQPTGASPERAKLTLVLALPRLVKVMS